MADHNNKFNNHKSADHNNKKNANEKQQHGSQNINKHTKGKEAHDHSSNKEYCSEHKKPCNQCCCK